MNLPNAIPVDVTDLQLAVWMIPLGLVLFGPVIVAVLILRFLIALRFVVIVRY